MGFLAYILQVLSREDARNTLRTISRSPTGCSRDPRLQKCLSGACCISCPRLIFTFRSFEGLREEQEKEKVLQKKKQEEEELKRKMATGEYYGFLDEIFMDLYMA